MIQDRFGGCHATLSMEAAQAFGDAVDCVAGHRTGAIDALERALAEDPGLVAAHALRGLACVVLGRAETVAIGRDNLRAARAALDASGRPTDFEIALVDALGLACEGRFLAAADRLDRRLTEDPHDFLAFKLVHSLRFMGGDAPGMLAATARVIPLWTSERPGAGFVYGCHAFALEEAGALDAAERFGERAVAIEPGDAWGLHAVSHIHETQLRLDEGVAWLERSRAQWSRCNNFRFHLAWHLALFRLEQGDEEEVLRLYDAEIRPAHSDDIRDVANATSLLWRLTQEGVAVGDRWDELAALAERRREDMTLIFATLHQLLALVASGSRSAALALADGLASAEQSEQGALAREVGAPLAQAMIGLDPPRGRALIDLARALPRLGGSNAQRDIFVRTLALAAASVGDGASLAGIQALRPKLRAQDRFARLAAARLDQACRLRRAVA